MTESLPSPDGATLETRRWLQRLRDRAWSLGFDWLRVVPAAPALHFAFFERWLERGNAADMGYLERGAAARRDPALLSQGSPVYRSLIVLGVDFYRHAVPESLLKDPSRGRIARYAWRPDYHAVIRPRLIELDHVLRECSGRIEPGKAFVDAGPVLERDFAAASGLSFTGKNCMSIVPGHGSHLFLATLSVPELLPYDAMPATLPEEPAPDQVLNGLPPKLRLPVRELEVNGRLRTGTCGACARCLTQCPTQAFVGPFHLDARRCISYWTIEAKTLAPEPLRASFGNWIFGCDDCQDVCPWNHQSSGQGARIPELRERPEWMAPPLLDGFAPEHPYWLDERAFADQFRHSPMRRAKRFGMLRNVCLALGNWADAATIAPLRALLEGNNACPSPSVRAAAVWALRRVTHKHPDAARGLLQQLQAHEHEPCVLQEYQSLQADG